jgi:hypothetical protein
MAVAVVMLLTVGQEPSLLQHLHPGTVRLNAVQVVQVSTWTVRLHRAADRVPPRRLTSFPKPMSRTADYFLAKAEELRQLTSYPLPFDRMFIPQPVSQVEADQTENEIDAAIRASCKHEPALCADDIIRCVQCGVML